MTTPTTNPSTCTSNNSHFTLNSTVDVCAMDWCPRCYKAFKPGSKESSRRQHLDSATCKERADAVSSYIAHTADRPDNISTNPPCSPPTTTHSVTPYSTSARTPAPYLSIWTQAQSLCPGFFFKWDVGDFYETYPMQIHRKATNTSTTFVLESTNPPLIRSTNCTGLAGGLGLSCEHCAWLNLDVNILRERASKPFSNVRSIDDLNWLQLRSKLDSREAEHNTVKLKASMYQNAKDSLSVARRRLESFEKLFSFLQETPVRGLHRILRNARTLGWSAERTLEKCRLAVAGKYTPGTFFDWETDVGMLVYELAGLSGVYALSKSIYALPSRNTLQKTRRQKRLQPSLFGVHLSEVYANVTTLFGDVTDSPSAAPTRRYLHTASFDETAKSATVDYFPDVDAMGGLCLEHLHHLTNVQIGDDITLIQAAAQLVREGHVHMADMVSVGAIAQLSRTGYGAKPVFMGSSCKNGDWKNVLRVIQIILEAWARSPDGEAKHGPITSVASDGDPKRRIAFFVLCMHTEVGADNPLHKFVKNLFGLNLFTGKNNLTMDFDFKHELKRICTTIRSPSGMYINGTNINRDMLLVWLERIPGHDWSEVSIEALLNPSDAQDVPRAVKLLIAIIDIATIDRNSLDPTELGDFDALCLFGALLDALLQPFINTTLSLSQQITSLVTFSFLLAAIYIKHSTSFIPNQLYGDLQAMVKNAVFMVAKTKLFDPELEVFLCLLGDDVLETLFGRVRMCGGHSPNCGLAEFCTRASSAMNLDAIFDRHPEMERTPDRLNIFRMQHVDHLRPRQFSDPERLRAKTCDLDACWDKAVPNAAAILHKFNAKLEILEAGFTREITFRQLCARAGTDLCRPLGGKYPSISSAVDRSIGETSRTASSEVDLESAAFKLTDPFAGLSTEEILAHEAPAPLVPFQMRSAFARIESASEKRVHKSSALRILFDLFLDFKEARDRLYRVRGFSGGGVIGWARQGVEGATVSSETHFQLGQLFVTLLSHNGVDIGLAVVKATSIKDGRSSKAKSISAVPRGELYLATAPYIVFGQVLSLVPLATTSEAGTSLAWVWDETFVFFSLAKKKVGSESIARGGNLQISVSTRLIEPFAEYGHEIATSELPDIHLNREKTWYFLDADLRTVWSRLWARVIEDERLHNKFPRFTGIAFPYLMRSTNELPGVIYSQSVAHSVVANTFRDAGACNVCGKTVKEETRQNHVGRHILMKILGVFDPNANPEVSTHYPCGFCGRNGDRCSVKIDGGKAHSDCPSLYAFRIWSAATTSQAKPCTNVPIRCPIINCTEIHWKYNFPQHLHDKHDLRAVDPSSSFLSLLLVSRQEQLALGIPPEKLIDWLASQVHGERPPESASDSVDGPASVSPIASNASPSRRRALSHASGKENVDPHLISPGKRRRVA
ncbi:hypothetical protein C8F01DRAFT_1370857 [Mycena amicta]|nr:hypothetical protein C8F01DRAFT_1370857 [Mycena amicta]